MITILLIIISLIFVSRKIPPKNLFIIQLVLIFALITTEYNQNNEVSLTIAYILYLTLTVFFFILIMDQLVTGNSLIQINTLFSKVKTLIVSNRNKIITSLFIILILRILFLLICNLTSMWNFYMTFFLQPELREFLIGPGIWYLTSLVSLLIIYLLIRNKVIPQVFIMLSLIYLLVFWMKIDYVFTKDLRDKVWIWEITPNRGTLWDTVQIKGVNFNDMPWQGQVILSDKSHRIIKWSNRLIEFELHPGISSTGDLYVRNTDGRVSNKFDFEVYDYFTNEVIN